MDRCINCGIATNRCNTLVGRSLNDETTLSVIRQWLAPQTVSNSDCICQACWDLAQSPHVDEQRQLGHRSVCLRCGRSLVTLRVSHQLHKNSIRESRIYNVIREWIMPRTIQEDSHICHACWVAADRAAVHMVSGPSTLSQIEVPQENQPQVDFPVETSNEGNNNNQPEQTIVLPEYMRAIETERRCFIQGCQRTERYRVPLSTRKMLLNQYKYYIPENNCLCDQHLVIEAWDFLNSLRSNYIQYFNAKHIQDMLSLKEVEDAGLLHFENIDTRHNKCYTLIAPQ